MFPWENYRNIGWKFCFLVKLKKAIFLYVWLKEEIVDNFLLRNIYIYVYPVEYVCDIFCTNFVEFLLVSS